MSENILGRAHNFIDLTGMTFGRLTVLSMAFVKNRETLWMCSCICGTTCVKLGRNISKGRTISCGCATTRLKPGEAGLNRVFKAYIQGSRERGLPFDLTKSEFKYITSEPCHYCGTLPKQVSTATNAKSSHENKRHGTYIHNGIDRKDNSLGYLLTNSVPCCKICNRAKSGMAYDEFVAYIDNIKAQA